MLKNEIRWHRSPVGGTEFTYVGDYKIVRFPEGRDTFYLVTKCEHGMPIESGHTFDYLDDVLDWIGV